MMKENFPLLGLTRCRRDKVRTKNPAVCVIFIPQNQDLPADYFASSDNSNVNCTHTNLPGECTGAFSNKLN